MAAADQVFGDNLRRLHIIRADQVNIVEIAGAGSKHQRHPGLRRAIAQLRSLVDRSGNHYAVDPLRHQGIKTLKHFFTAVSPLSEEHHSPLRLKRVGQSGGHLGVERLR